MHRLPLCVVAPRVIATIRLVAFLDRLAFFELPVCRPHLTPRFPFGFDFFAVLAVASPLLQLFAVAEFAQTSKRPSSFVLVFQSIHEKAANQDGESNWLCVRIATTFRKEAGIPGVRSEK